MQFVGYGWGKGWFRLKSKQLNIVSRGEAVTMHMQSIFKKK